MRHCGGAACPCILTLFAAHCSLHARATTRWRVCTGVSGGGRTRRTRPAAGRPGLTGGAVRHCGGAACPSAEEALTHSIGQHITRSGAPSKWPHAFERSVHFTIFPFVSTSSPISSACGSRGQAALPLPNRHFETSARWRSWRRHQGINRFLSATHPRLSAPAGWTIPPPDPDDR